MTDDLEMKNCICNTALLETYSEELTGSCITYVDDALYAEGKTFQHPTKKTEVKLKCNKNKTIRSFLV